LIMSARSRYPIPHASFQDIEPSENITSSAIDSSRAVDSSFSLLR
jgi:hypothetical protein